MPHTHTFGYRNKPRLELALYARPKHPDTYHWALFVAAKSSKGKPSTSVTKRHVLNTLQNVDGALIQPWRYEKVLIQDYTRELRLLARIVIGKILVLDFEAEIEKSIGPVPVYQDDDEDQQMAKSFSCRTWIQAAVEELRKDGIVSLKGSWEEIVAESVKYVEKKRAEGRWSEEWKGVTTVSMLDLFDGIEIMA